MIIILSFLVGGLVISFILLLYLVFKRKNYISNRTKEASTEKNSNGDDTSNINSK